MIFSFDYLVFNLFVYLKKNIYNRDHKNESGKTDQQNYFQYLFDDNLSDLCLSFFFVTRENVQIIMNFNFFVENLHRRFVRYILFVLDQCSTNIWIVYVF